jgi:acyl-CoA synthetase (AMP-forming)/AMP-acid ligase II
MKAFDTHAPLLPEILALHGKWKGQKPALVFEDTSLSWNEFNTATNRVATALNANKVARGHTVGVIMSNGSDMVEVMIGIMKSGACSVPINLSVTDDALNSMLNDAGVKAIFTSPEHAGRMAPYIADHPDTLLIITGTPFMEFKASGTDTAPAVQIKDDDPLNIIYSSGTTGTPKGIVHTHKGRRDWAYDLAISLRYNSSCKTLFTIGLYSNISWVGMLCTLLVGGTMVVHKSFDANDTLTTIENYSITNFAMVPIQLQRLLEVPNSGQYDLSSIQAIMSCGSPLFEELKTKLFKRLGPNIVIELFGLTEGVITTLEPEEAVGRMASVGKPLIGTDIKIVGDDDHEVETGMSGEIVGCGRIIMPGYLNRPEATQNATWTDPDGKAWLRTGDIGTLDQDGYLYVVDRKKDMILSGGQNIYPQDIETVLFKHTAVNDVAVIGVPSKKWGESPLAIIVPEGDADISPNTLQAWANDQLGKQQRLSGVVFTKALPRNPNGKILKRELRETYKGALDG